VSNIPVPGNTVLVVMTQLNAIPANAVYRKEIGGLWSEFGEDANNTISSAPGTLGVCPPPGSDTYESGLTEGDYCVQLGIEDGGVNDADGVADGKIIDPGGVTVKAAVQASATDASGHYFHYKNASAGGAVGWPLLMLFAFGVFIRKGRGFFIERGER